MTTAAKLINQSYYMSNVIDPEEEVPGFYESEGLTVLNTIIDEWGSLQIYIPSYAKKIITTTANVYQYSVTPIITEFLEGHLLDSSNVQSILREADLKEQNTFNYALSLSGPTRPSRVFFENDQLTNGIIQETTTVFLYPVPDRVYTATLYVKNRLPEFTLSDDITNVPRFYYKALKYQLAKELSIIYSSVLSPRFDEEYESVMRNLKAANKKDMTVSNSNPLNINRRFRPWGSFNV